MTLNEKIKLLSKNKGWRLKDLHQTIKDVFGDNAVTYFTLSRTGKANTKFREKTLHQVCSVLGITKKQLLKDVDSIETTSAESNFLKSADNFGTLCYSKDAYLELLTKKNSPLKRSRLVISSGGQTKLSKGEKDYLTSVYVLEGVLTLYTGNTHISLRRDESISFQSSLPHQFLNKGSHQMRCLVDQFIVKDSEETND